MDEKNVQSELSAGMLYKWRLKSVTNKAKKPYPAGTRGQFLAYIDARDVFNRLDAVLGPFRWQDSVKRMNEDGSVIVALSLKPADEWLTKEDIGYPNNPGAGVEDEPLKAAVSDGIKRAAVHFGIGRFLYELSAQWVDIDANGRPQKPLPVWENPTPSPAAIARFNQSQTVWQAAKARGWELPELKRFAIAELGREPAGMDTAQLADLLTLIAAPIVAESEMEKVR